MSDCRKWKTEVFECSFFANPPKRFMHMWRNGWVNYQAYFCLELVDWTDGRKKSREWYLSTMSFFIPNKLVFTWNGWISKWWFQIFLIFTPTSGNHPMGLIFFLQIGWFNHQPDIHIHPVAEVWYDWTPQNIPKQNTFHLWISRVRMESVETVEPPVGRDHELDWTHFTPPKR